MSMQKKSEINLRPSLVSAT